jgi:uncharacterized protein (UPF0264 family)
MTLFLASVRDAAEAEMAIRAGADIIDLKDPHQGALGALPLDAIATSVRSVARRAPVSATVGDLPMHAESIRDALLAASATGVDYVKLGLFPGSDAERCLGPLQTEAPSARLILVVFADALPNFDAIGAAVRAGIPGIMLDTLGKDGRSLLDHLSLDALGSFVTRAKAEGLTAGLAGSLRAEHVPALLALRPDVLGFRGALCQGGARNATFDPVAAASIRALIPQASPVLAKADLPSLAPQALC